MLNYYAKLSEWKAVHNHLQLRGNKKGANHKFILSPMLRPRVWPCIKIPLQPRPSLCSTSGSASGKGGREGGREGGNMEDLAAGREEGVKRE